MNEPTPEDPAALLFSQKRALAGQAWEGLGTQSGSSWLQAIPPAMWLEKLFMNSACLSPGSPANPAGAFHR